ncbi:MAG: iron complex transport system substrate-binding protein [Nitriliruptoraceae bacterium]|jgi:iron complex transport system substrate-binding protein
MSRTILRRIAPAILLAVSLTACATDPLDPSSQGTAPTTAASADTATEADSLAAFPVVITHDGGDLTLDEAPTRIVTLSATATEMLFAIGAGELIVAADSYSNYPAEAPTIEDLSAFDPNVEAILGYDPDLVIASGDRNDMVAGLAAVGVDVILQGSAVTLDDTYRQIGVLGDATGRSTEAGVVNTEIEQALAGLTDGAAGEGLGFYHELSADLYSVTSTTFIGEIYGLFGLENIADPADADGAAFGYPQLSAEYLVEADPELVFLACTVFCSETTDTFGARDGFDTMSAVTGGNVIELNDDVASRWGPRVVEFAEAIAKALANLS